MFYKTAYTSRGAKGLQSILQCLLKCLLVTDSLSLKFSSFQTFLPPLYVDCDLLYSKKLREQ